jgi:hypothetical protein
VKEAPIHVPSRKAAVRLGDYTDHLASIRRTDIRPPVKTLEEARKDILLYIIAESPKQTQVWIKGAITETFNGAKKTPSWTIAHRYANKWRGLNAEGKVTEDAKNRRLATRVLLAVQGKPGFKVIEESLFLKKAGKLRDDIQDFDLPDFDTYKLKGARANPAAPFYYSVDGQWYAAQAKSKKELKAALKHRYPRHQIQVVTQKEFRSNPAAPFRYSDRSPWPYDKGAGLNPVDVLSFRRNGGARSNPAKNKQILRKSDIDRNARYTIWFYSPYNNYYSIDRSYRGAAIVDVYWADMKKQNKEDSRKYVLFPQGIDPNKKGKR